MILNYKGYLDLSALKYRAATEFSIYCSMVASDSVVLFLLRGILHDILVNTAAYLSAN